MAKGDLTEGASTLVALLVNDSTKPNGNKLQMRAAAEGLMGAVETDLDRAWLHVVIGRTYTEDEVEQAIVSMVAAYELATAHDLVGPLTHSGLSLYVMYVKTEQHDKAHAILGELGKRALAGTIDKLTLAGLGLGRQVGRGLLAFGETLVELSERSRTQRAAGNDSQNSTKQS
ncbi:MAG TPA: hypothetical protein VJM32_04735 [Candidatus Saccharimonadales bacterium]|nr:hypothetical protein [Candidatus Saccharimonadales bacterium]